MKISSPASVWPAWVMPNSAACLMELMVSPPALARPMTCAPEACACSRKDEKSVPGNGCLTRAEHLAAGRCRRRRWCPLQRVAEGVVGGEEEPVVVAGLDHGAAGALGEGPGVVGPVDGVGRALGAGQVGRAGARVDEDLVLLLGDLVDRERDRRGRHVDDHVDAVLVVPLAGDVGGDVGLVLVVGRDDLDLDALAGGVEVLDRHAGGDDRAFARQVGIDAGAVVQHADLDGGLGQRPGLPAAGWRPRRAAGSCKFHRWSPPVGAVCGGWSDAEIGVQLVDVGVELGVGDHVDHPALLDDVVPVGDRGREAEVLFDQDDGEALGS